MTIHLKFFSTLRIRLQMAEMEMVLSKPKRADQIFFGLFENPDEAKRFLASTRVALNCEYVDPSRLVHEGDELAFIPPVSGG